MESASQCSVWCRLRLPSAEPSKGKACWISPARLCTRYNAQPWYRCRFCDDHDHCAWGNEPPATQKSGTAPLSLSLSLNKSGPEMHSRPLILRHKIPIIIELMNVTPDWSWWLGVPVSLLIGSAHPFEFLQKPHHLRRLSRRPCSSEKRFNILLYCCFLRLSV